MNFGIRLFDNVTSRRITDYLAIAIAVSLPWSTTATLVLIILWLLAFLPIINLPALRREIFTPAGGIPLLLIAWAILGMFWSDNTWAERFEGLRQFHKLLFIPLFLAYFRYSERCPTVIMSFFASCIALLLLSWTTALWPEIQTWRSQAAGVPVKNHITQSAEFAICAMCLFYLAIEARKQRNSPFAVILFLIALGFIANIVFVATGRAELLIIGILVILFCARWLGWKGALLGVLMLGGIAIAAWNASEYLRTRVNNAVLEVEAYRKDGSLTSAGLRLELWRKSIGFISEAPLIGHGTGSTTGLLEKSALGKTGAAGVVTTNPHNQILVVAIPLGLIGAIILCAMWFAHLKMFFGSGPTAWIGIVIVVQNILGSLFNSQLFDFTEGWFYVFGVALMGGLRKREADSPAPREMFYSENDLWPQKVTA